VQSIEVVERLPIRRVVFAIKAALVAIPMAAGAFIFWQKLL
jgi:hypothetical protein